MSDGPGLNDLFPPVDNDSLSILSYDVEEIVSLARRGDNLPLAAGIITAWWGFLLAVTNIYQIFAQLHFAPGPLPISLIQIPLGYLGSFLMMAMDKKRRHLLAWRSQVISATWLFSGVVIIVFMMGIIVSKQIDDVVANSFLSLIFALNFGVMAASRLTNWLVFPAAGWIVVAILTFIFPGPPALQSLFFGVGAFSFMLVPGVALHMQERRALI